MHILSCNFKYTVYKQFKHSEHSILYTYNLNTVNTLYSISNYIWILVSMTPESAFLSQAQTVVFYVLLHAGELPVSLVLAVYQVEWEHVVVLKCRQTVLPDQNHSQLLQLQISKYICSDWIAAILRHGFLLSLSTLLEVRKVLQVFP